MGKDSTCYFGRYDAVFSTDDSQIIRFLVGLRTLPNQSINQSKIYHTLSTANQSINRSTLIHFTKPINQSIDHSMIHHNVKWLLDFFDLLTRSLEISSRNGVFEILPVVLPYRHVRRKWPGRLASGPWRNSPVNPETLFRPLSPLPPAKRWAKQHEQLVKWEWRNDWHALFSAAVNPSSSSEEACSSSDASRTWVFNKTICSSSDSYKWEF